MISLSLIFVLIACLTPLFGHAESSPAWPNNTTLDRAESLVKGVGFSPDSNYVAYMEDKGQVYVHRVGGEWPLVHVFHESDVHRAGDVEFTNDGQSLVYGFLNNDRNAVLQVVDVDGWEKGTRRTHSSRSGYSAGMPANLQFSGDDQWLVTGTNSNHCYVWNAAEDYALEKVFTPSRYSQNPTGLAVDQSGEHVLVTASRGSPDVYETGSWERVTTLKNLSRSAAPAIGHNRTMVFSDKSDHVWVYVANGGWSEVAEFKTGGVVGRSRFSTTNDWLALGDNQGNLTLVSTDQWNERATLNQADASVTGISFSSADKYLAYASDNRVFVHSVPSEKPSRSHSETQLPLKELSGETVSQLILNKQGSESVLTIKYGNGSNLDVSYGSDFLLNISDEPGEGLDIKLELNSRTD